MESAETNDVSKASLGFGKDLGVSAVASCELGSAGVVAEIGLTDSDNGTVFSLSCVISDLIASGLLMVSVFEVFTLLSVIGGFFAGLIDSFVFSS